MLTPRSRTDAHRRRSRVALLGLAVTLAALLAGCSSSPSGSASGGATISMANLAFSPTSLTVSPGQTITVVNNDAVKHNVTGNNGAFDTGVIAPGRSKTFTAPVAPGHYGYTCTLHPFMTGTIVVR